MTRPRRETHEDAHPGAGGVERARGLRRGLGRRTGAVGRAGSAGRRGVLAPERRRDRHRPPVCRPGGSRGVRVYRADGGSEGRPGDRPVGGRGTGSHPPARRTGGAASRSLRSTTGPSRSSVVPGSTSRWPCWAPRRTSTCARLVGERLSRWRAATRCWRIARERKRDSVPATEYRPSAGGRRSPALLGIGTGRPGPQHDEDVTSPQPVTVVLPGRSGRPAHGSASAISSASAPPRPTATTMYCFPSCR